MREGTEGLALAHTQLGTAGDFFWLCRMFPNSVLRCHFQSPAHTPCDGLFPFRKSFFGPLRLSCCLPPFHTHYIQQVLHRGAVSFFLLFSVQKFAGSNKLQQSGNRSMSYLAGKADRCVVSAGVFSQLCPGAMGKA